MKKQNNKRLANKTDGNKIHLSIFIAGCSGASARALANISKLEKANPEIIFVIEVFDVFHNPVSALENAVLVTPFIIRHLPEPEMRIAGDLSNQFEVESLLITGKG